MLKATITYSNDRTKATLKLEGDGTVKNYNFEGDVEAQLTKFILEKEPDLVFDDNVIVHYPKNSKLPYDICYNSLEHQASKEIPPQELIINEDDNYLAYDLLLSNGYTIRTEKLNNNRIRILFHKNT